MSTQSIDLNLFCAEKDDLRDWMKNPMAFKNGVAATNGFLLVLLDNFENTSLPSPPEGFTEEFEKLLTKEPITDFSKILFVPEISYKPCIECSGTGEANLCPECDGEGEVIATTEYSEYEVECNTCNGTGYDKSDTRGIYCMCESCNGKGKVIDRSPTIEIHSVNLAIWLLRKIATLPNVRFANVDFNMLRFRFDGGEGFVMGVTRGQKKAA